VHTLLTIVNCNLHSAFWSLPPHWKAAPLPRLPVKLNAVDLGLKNVPSLLGVAALAVECALNFSEFMARQGQLTKPQHVGKASYELFQV
jgi:hypothetical protein